jgi:hypothetical protein
MGVTGSFPAEGFVGDGLGQSICQLAGVGVIGLLAFLVGWLVFLGLNAPYRPRRERKPKVEDAEAVFETEPEFGFDEAEAE